MAVIQMPSRGGKDETGMITTWYKKTGDWVAQGDELFSFDTDEGTYTVKSQKAGRLVAIFVPEGELVHCPADVGMLSAPTPDSVLNLGRQSYLDEASAPAEPSAEEAADAPEEPAPEATEESAPEATEEPAPEATEEPEFVFTGKVGVRMLNTGDIYLGDTVVLMAVVLDANAEYTISWEVCKDGLNWEVLEENADHYSFVVNEVNAVYSYRAVLNVAE